MSYLWKEWRDNRAVVIGYLISLPLLQLLAALVVPGKVIGDAAFATLSAAAGLGVAALAFGSDLVPGEARRGTLGFLDRLPRGLTAAFLGKAAFLLLTAGLFTGFGLATAWLVQSIFADVSGLDPRIQLYGVLAVCFFCWVFVVSTWLPRGTLALPATAIVLGLFALPIYLALQANPGLAFAGDADDIFHWWLIAGSFGAAWLCFARGRRFGRGAWASAWRGLVVLVLLFTPAWGHVAVKVSDYRYFDAEDENLVISEGYLGSGGRYLFLNGRMASRGKRPTHAFIVDLEDGSWRKAGGPDDWFLPVGELGSAWWKMRRTRAIPAVARREAGTERKGKWWMHYHDGRSAEVVKSGWSDMRFPEVESLHPRGPTHVPDGFRLAVGPRGLGYEVENRRGTSYFDPFREKLYPRRTLAQYSRVYIRPGEWLARIDDRYLLLDPDTLQERPATEVERINWMLDDGRVVTTRDDNLVVIAPATGEVTDVGVGYNTLGVARFPDGRWLMIIATGDQRAGYARLDPKTLAVDPIPALDGLAFGDFDLLAVEDDDTFLGIYKKRQIVRVRVGGDTRELLFPR